MIRDSYKSSVFLTEWNELIKAMIDASDNFEASLKSQTLKLEAPQQANDPDGDFKMFENEEDIRKYKMEKLISQVIDYENPDRVSTDEPTIA